MRLYGRSRGWSKREDAIIRSSYLTDGVSSVAARLDRSERATAKRARHLRVMKLRPWTQAEDSDLTVMWGPHSIPQIARKLGRTTNSVYWRARALKLGLGCPQGYEYLWNACKRTGYAASQLRAILKWAGVKLLCSLARPGSGRPSPKHIVEPADVDEAVAAWCLTETVTEGARRHGWGDSVLRRLLHDAIARGDTRIPHPPERERFRWRVPSTLIDELFATHAKRESVQQAADRVGVTCFRLSKWLHDAGFDTGHGVFLLPADVDRIVADHRSLETVNQAAKRHRRSHPFVWEIVQRAVASRRLVLPPRAPRQHIRIPRATYDALIAEHLACPPRRGRPPKSVKNIPEPITTAA